MSDDEIKTKRCSACGMTGYPKRQHLKSWYCEGEELEQPDCYAMMTSPRRTLRVVVEIDAYVPKELSDEELRRHVVVCDLLPEADVLKAKYA